MIWKKNVFLLQNAIQAPSCFQLHNKRHVLNSLTDVVKIITMKEKPDIALTMNVCQSPYSSALKPTNMSRQEETGPSPPPVVLSQFGTGVRFWNLGDATKVLTDCELCSQANRAGCLLDFNWKQCCQWLKELTDTNCASQFWYPGKDSVYPQIFYQITINYQSHLQTMLYCFALPTFLKPWYIFVCTTRGFMVLYLSYTTHVVLVMDRNCGHRVHPTEV